MQLRFSHMKSVLERVGYLWVRWPNAMKKQWQLQFSSGGSKTFDLNDNEGLVFYFEYNANAHKQNRPHTNLQIEGSRWDDEDNFSNISWAGKKLSVGDEITFKYIESNLPTTPPNKDEIYVRPETECNFCGKKESEVRQMFQADMFSAICNESVNLFHEKSAI